MLYFLSGLPRSGSTLLGALLSQRPDTYVSATSGLTDIMGAAVTTWEQHPATKAQGANPVEGIRIIRAIADAKYADRTEKVLIDKSRGWPAPQIQKTMEQVLGKPPKIIATVRPIAECLASFVRLIKPQDVKNLCKNSQLAMHLFSSYQNLKQGYESAPKNILFVSYDDIVNNPQKELDRVADFLEIDRFKHTFEDIKNPIKENDAEAWSVPGLHDIRSKVKKEKYDPKEILGELWDHYQGGEFWTGKPEPKREPQLIDIQLKAGLEGDFEKGWEIAQQLEKERPNDDRAAFNRGWYLLSQGKLQEGHRLLDRGRNEDVFGNRHIGTIKPIWDGYKKETVLLNLEGGLGDQIHGVRWAKNISAKGCKVIVSCSPELVPILKNVEGVTAIVQHEAVLGVHHDSWVPSMSGVVPLNYEYEDLKGNPYIPKPKLESHNEPILKSLAIEINSACNRKCVWCPNHKNDREVGFLDDEIFYKIIDELKEMEFKGKITFNLYNEPLLDKRLLTFIRYIRKNIPSTYIYLNTNGDSLNLDLWKELRKEGLDFANISQYDGKINENIQKILSELNPKEKEHFGSKIFNPDNICNRAGLVESKRMKTPLKQYCNKPFSELCINYKGKVILCCNDYFSAIEIGDLKKQSIKEIWGSEIFKYYREKLLKGERVNLELCNLCDDF